MPKDQGQIVEVAWADAGEAGAVCRITDRSNWTIRYRLHPWLACGEFQPQNGRTGTSRRGRRITQAEAERLIDRASGCEVRS